MSWEVGIDIYTLLCVKHIVGSCCVTPGAHFGALMTWKDGMGGRGGGPSGRGYMYTYC